MGAMPIEKMIELLNIEHLCMLRGAANGCDRQCAACDLVQDSIELDEMYTGVIALIRKNIPQKVVDSCPSEHLIGLTLGRCPACNGTISTSTAGNDKPTHFCKYCGQAVSFE